MHCMMIVDVEVILFGASGADTFELIHVPHIHM